MRLEELDYPLPAERIAQEPLPQRDASRLLVVDRATGSLRHSLFRDLPELLAPGDVLVRNDTRVLPAALRGRRTSGGRVYLLLVHAESKDSWRALVRGSTRFSARPETLRLESGLEVRVERTSDLPPGEVRVSAPALGAEAERAGLPPLPPYIRREATAEDHARYQTLYARDPGSVAAPTAGLHFTPALEDRLRARGVELVELTLHIGPGTFQPVRSSRVEDHRLRAEPYWVPPATLEAVAAATARGSRVVAVGTSSVRALETALLRGEPRGSSDLLVSPGFAFRGVTSLLTNFHQPRTTLLALVAAFLGTETLHRAYRAALDEGYRFLSYGDAMLALGPVRPSRSR